MNDFTKEELELIHDGLAYAAGSSMETGGMMKDILYPVAKKIKFMINNYCDHNNHGGESEIFVDTCAKCNKYILREFKNGDNY